MTQKRWNFLSGLIIVTTIFMNSAGIAKSLPEISSNSDSQNSKPLYFGYLPDAYPISFQDGYTPDGGLLEETFCGKLHKFLKERFEKQKPSRNVITFRLDYTMKFTRERTDPKNSAEKINLDISCFPATITLKRQNRLEYKHDYIFSNPFYSDVKTKILVRKSVQGLLSFLNRPVPLNNLNILVINGTTTEEYLTNLNKKPNLNIHIKGGAD